jgi:hypothetical protein
LVQPIVFSPILQPCAIALLHPFMVFGLLVGDGQFQTRLNALLLLVTNVVCVNISGAALLLYQGVRPNSWWEAKKQTRIAIAVWMVYWLFSPF